MRVLIDTHTFLWMATQPEKLSPKAKAACTEGDLYLSVASVWEISIKYRIGRLPLPAPPANYLPQQIDFARASLLPIHFKHAIAAGRIDSPHKDRFDRMLAAQCLEEKLACVSRDPFFRLCGVETIW